MVRVMLLFPMGSEQTGAEVVDMFVEPNSRGHALSAMLIAGVASRVRTLGGVFIKGQAVTRPGAQSLYERVAMSFPGAGCVVGGRVGLKGDSSTSAA